MTSPISNELTNLVQSSLVTKNVFKQEDKSLLHKPTNTFAIQSSNTNEIGRLALKVPVNSTESIAVARQAFNYQVEAQHRESEKATQEIFLQFTDTHSIIQGTLDQLKSSNEEQTDEGFFFQPIEETSPRTEPLPNLAQENLTTREQPQIGQVKSENLIPAQQDKTHIPALLKEEAAKIKRFLKNHSVSIFEISRKEASASQKTREIENSVVQLNGQAVKQRVVFEPSGKVYAELYSLGKGSEKETIAVELVYSKWRDRFKFNKKPFQAYASISKHEASIHSFLKQKKSQGVNLSRINVGSSVTLLSSKGNSTEVTAQQALESTAYNDVEKNALRTQLALKIKEEASKKILPRKLDASDFIVRRDKDNKVEIILRQEEFGLLAPLQTAGTVDKLLIDKSLSQADKYFIIAETAKALSQLHQAGIAHCDLNPSNFLVVRNSKKQISGVKLADFGRSGFIGKQLPERDFLPIHYSDPDIYSSPIKLDTSKTYSEVADNFQLGILFFQIFSDVPFKKLHRIRNADIQVLLQTVGLTEEDKKKGLTLENVRNPNNTFARALYWKLHVKDWPSWKNLNLDAKEKDLLLKILSTNPEQRPDLNTIAKFFASKAKEAQKTTFQVQPLHHEIERSLSKETDYAPIATQL